jgi:uncharacterized protein YbbC (DUF1343 family)
MMSSVSFTLGSDVLFDRQLLQGRTIGLVCNPASINAGFQHVIDRAETSGVRLGAIFGPQHGFRSDLQENMIESSHAEDARRRVPIYSLYSETREPTAEMLQGIDALVVDLQDVGTRIYTYIYTMAHCLRAARRHDMPVVVCDRPNPIGGVAVEGPMLDPGFESFVGQFPIPMRHGMTIGELARLFNDHFGIGAKLEVVAMPAWSRTSFYDDAGLPWVLPSPNIPTLDSAIVYPGTVLFEGTNVSEGRGTTKPFELVGAPWVDPEPFAARLNALGLPGVFFRPVLFEPTFHKHAGSSCGGCQIHITDRHTIRPVEIGIALLKLFRDMGQDHFAWREPPYEYEYLLAPIDILCGSSEVRERLEHGEDARTIAAAWEAPVAAFEEIREKFLLY